MPNAKQDILAYYLCHHPESALQGLLGSSPDAVAKLLRDMDSDAAVNTLNLLSSSSLAAILVQLEDEFLARLAGKLQRHLIARIFRQWNSSGLSNRVLAILTKLEPKVRRQISKLISYSESELGGLMNPVPFTVTEELTVHEVLSALGQEKNRYSRYIYVVDKDLKLTGVLPFKDAFFASNKATPIEEIMTRKVITFNAHLPAAKAFHNPVWTSWDSMPVTNATGVLIGVVKFRDLENFLSKTETIHDANLELLKAGEAVGEVLQIGISATIAAFKLSGSKP